MGAEPTQSYRSLIGTWFNEDRSCTALWRISIQEDQRPGHRGSLRIIGYSGVRSRSTPLAFGSVRGYGKGEHGHAGMAVDLLLTSMGTKVRRGSAERIEERFLMVELDGPNHARVRYLAPRLQREGAFHEDMSFRRARRIGREKKRIFGPGKGR